jgi:hypothetical protein
MVVFAIKYEDETDIYLVRGSCREEAAERWVKSVLKRNPAFEIHDAFIDVRTVPFKGGVYDAGDLAALFTPLSAG